MFQESNRRVSKISGVKTPNLWSDRTPAISMCALTATQGHHVIMEVSCPLIPTYILATQVQEIKILFKQSFWITGKHILKLS